jgi:hypothetical protein
LFGQKWSKEQNLDLQFARQALLPAKLSYSKSIVNNNVLAARNGEQKMSAVGKPARHDSPIKTAGESWRAVSASSQRVKEVMILTT